MRKLGIDSKHRKSLLRKMVTDLIEKGTVITTVPKAKETRRLVDKTITLAKKSETKGIVNAKRSLLNILTSEQVATNLLENLSKFKKRTSGYTTYARLGQRRGDDALMCVLKLLDNTNS